MTPIEDMQKDLLIPTDFSACSESALLCAIEWAKQSDAMLHVYHRIKAADDDWVSGFIYDTSGLTDSRYDESRAQLTAIEDKITAAGLEYDFIFSGGKVSDFVERYARKRHIDYVFMGSHGRNKKEREKLGSNALEVLVDVEVPVLIAKESLESFSIKQVVFASNFDEHARGVFRGVLEFLKHFDPEIHFLHIDTPKIFSATKFIMIDVLNDFKAIAAEYKTQTHFHRESHVGRGVVDFCDQLGADLIAFSESGRTFFGERRFAKPVDYLLQNARQPVLFVAETPEEQ